MIGAVNEVIVIDDDGNVEGFDIDIGGEEEREKEIVFIDSDVDEDDDGWWDWDSDEIMEDQEEGGRGGEKVPEDTDTMMAERYDDSREWGELAVDLLAQIFNRLPADEVMRSAALVCTSWKRAIFWKEHRCWTQINLKEWCRRVNRTDVIDHAIGKLVGLCSSFSLHSISAYRIGPHSFFRAASRGQNISILQIPMSEVNDAAIISSVSSLPRLTILDISYCFNITHQGISAIGAHCSKLVELQRNMAPPEPQVHPPEHGEFAVDENEALAIANTMPCLQYLELCFGLFTDIALLDIVTQCMALNVLDVRGCWSVEMDGVELMRKCSAIADFKGPCHHLHDDEDDHNDHNDDGDG